MKSMVFSSTTTIHSPENVKNTTSLNSFVVIVCSYSVSNARQELVSICRSAATDDCDACCEPKLNKLL